MPNKLYRCSLRLEQMKIGRKPDPTKPTLDQILQTQAARDEAKKCGVHDVGIDLTLAENKALNAVQKLFDDTNYDGNVPPVKLPADNPFRYTDPLPVIMVSKAEYFDAYGVKRYQTKRGKSEHSSRVRESAMNSMRSLAQRREQRA